MRYFLILICLLLVFTAVGCETQQEETVDITPYLNSLMEMDYEAMFSYCSPVVDIDKEGFVKKYSDIFSGLGITKITIDSISAPSDDGEFNFTATYYTEKYGDFSNVFNLKTGIVDDKRMVLWDYNLIFPEMSEGCSVKVSTVHASRGEMFASDGTIVASNSFAYTVFMDTSKVNNLAKVAEAVNSICDLSETKVVNMFNKALKDETKIVVLGEFYKDELTQEQKDLIVSISGLGIDDAIYTPIRDYPMDEYMAHIVGYTGFYSEENLPEGYTTSDRAGLTGLEAAYESELRGSDGKIVYIKDGWGKNIRTLYLDPCSEGHDLRLTIDPILQKRAFDSLVEFLDIEKEETGVAIVMDASNGYVEAMASFPSYDNNFFTFGRPSEYWDYLNASESKQPMYNRATQGWYPPGSVFKPFTAAVALETGAITKDTEFTGRIVNNQWRPDEEGWCWEPITRVHASDPPLKLENALVHSDNIFFAFAAMQTDQDKFIEYFERIGMDESVPFDIPVKSANLVTSELDRRLIADMGYGQGEFAMSPLQVASMYTAFANGTGDMLQPILVEKMCQTDGLDYNVTQTFEKTVWKENAVSGSSVDILQPMLKKVVTSGTGAFAKINGVSIAGKTGTAEIGSDKSREISWFVGYWTDGYYPRLVVVMVDTASGQGKVKFDIAKKLLNP